MTTAKNHTEGGAEKQKSQERAKETVQLAVKQPEKITSLLAVLSDLEKISEVVSDQDAGDLGGASGSGSGQAGGVSPRDKAIQSLPSVPIMRKRLSSHLQKEMKQLERKAKRLALSAQKGSAHALNELYARIRKIQALIAELVDAAAEVVTRLYVRLFIDEQQLV